MVKATENVPLNANGELDVDSWYESLCQRYELSDSELIVDALRFVSCVPHRAQEFLDKGVEFANLVAALNMDATSIAAALTYRPLRTRSVKLTQIEASVSPEVAILVDAVVRMADTSLLEMSNTKMQTSESRDQVENVRRMLVSMIDDARVAVLKLAERVVALRSAKGSSEERKQRIAQEAHQVFAPLANRLGVWQLKWELEDLALRYLAPDVYKALAKQLDGRRTEREQQVEDIARSVESRLRERGIEASVSGRAKHLYSIWRKIRVKGVGLDEVYDVRAIRILVPDIAQCYATLGIIHTEWQHIPSEFDDYIAVPKENGYRSIHTAVVSDDAKTLEVQIRTREMHAESELGVCAHWAYKDTPADEDDSYEKKMNWMRQVVEWQEEASQRVRHESIGLELRDRVSEERIFVYTPKGHVLDLTTGATVVDFAYRVHTEVGHRCVGAKVDGDQVALNTCLSSGQRVEIITDADATPQRAWLDDHLDFVRTARAREKIDDWFRSRDREENERAGQRLLGRTALRLNLAFPVEAQLRTLSGRYGLRFPGEFYAALGIGDLQLFDVMSDLLGGQDEPVQIDLLSEVAPRSKENFGIEVIATDRPGLLLDISTYLDHNNIALVSNVGRVLPGTSEASICLEVQLPSLLELMRVMDWLKQIPSVSDTRRIELQQSTGALS